MGRTLYVRALLAVVILSSLLLPATSSKAAPLQDRWDDLDAWLEQLCFLVHCPADRFLPAEKVDEFSATDIAAVEFVLSYQVIGVRQDLSYDEQDYALAVLGEAASILEENPGRLEPEVEKALVFTLESLKSELGK